MVNHFFAAWQRNGWEAGPLGYPTTDEIVNPGGGRRQEFQNTAAIYWLLNEAYAIRGAVRDKWNTLGAEQGPLGYPSSDELSVTKYNGRYNNFKNGTITWSGITGARVLYKPIRDRWVALGREDGALGFPTTDEKIAPDGVGHFVGFESGSPIYWSPPSGAWELSTNTLPVWAATNYEKGALGYPAGPPTVIADALDSQLFQSGVLATYQDGAANVFHY